MESRPEGRRPVKLKERPVLGGNLEVVTNALTMGEARVSAQAVGKFFRNSEDHAGHKWGFLFASSCLHLH